jgi:hypothetical protein
MPNPATTEPDDAGARGGGQPEKRPPLGNLALERITKQRTRIAEGEAQPTDEPETRARNRSRSALLPASQGLPH